MFQEVLGDSFYYFLWRQIPTRNLKLRRIDTPKSMSQLWQTVATPEKLQSLPFTRNKVITRGVSKVLFPKSLITEDIKIEKSKIVVNFVGVDHSTVPLLQ